MTKKKIARTKPGTKGAARRPGKGEEPIGYVPTEQPIDAEIRRAAERAGITTRSVECKILHGDLVSYASDVRSAMEELLNLLTMIEVDSDAIDEMEYIVPALAKLWPTVQWMDGEARHAKLAAGGAS